MERVEVKCPQCAFGHRMGVAQQADVVCARCGHNFWADTRDFVDGGAHVREIGLAPFSDAVNQRSLSYGRYGPPVATLVEPGKSLFRTAKGACPHCRHRMKADSIPSRCPYCSHYSMARDSYLHPISESFVSQLHIFSVPMGVFEKEDLPAVCCACGEPANRVVEQMILPGRTVGVPHCKQHSAGAVVGSEELRWALDVKSYRFYCVAMLRGGSVLF